METLRGLDKVQFLTQPIPNDVTAFMQDKIARGRGEFGTFTVYDYLGSAAGQITTNAFENINSALATFDPVDLQNLTTAYNWIANLWKGVYTSPVPGFPDRQVTPVGTYNNKNLAFSQGLYPNAIRVLGLVIARYPTQVTTLNNNFAWICQQYNYEYVNQQKAGLDMTQLQDGSNQSTISFIKNLGNYGLDVEIQGTSDFLTAIADMATQSGQAIIGSLREGRNSRIMDSST